MPPTWPRNRSATKYSSDPYSGEVAYVDQELGKLLADGRKNGWTDRTLVVLTGDHGESLGEHGESTHSYFAYNSTLHIPLLIAGPGIKSSRVKDAVAHIDLFPTVCDLLGVAPPAGLQGESLAPALAGKAGKARPIYIESLEAFLNRGWAPLHGYIENGKKFIDLPIPELYDLEKDFGEKTNLAAGTDLAAYRKKLDDLRKSSGARPAQSDRRVDAETRDRLRSLGYLVSPVTKVKSKFGPEDDLKTLAPLDQKLTMAEVLKRAGKVAESVKMYEELIKAKPDFAAPYDFLYQLYRSQNLLGEGLAVLERGYKANPDNYILVAAYGIALVKAGRLDAGTTVLEKAAGAFDQDAEVWHSLGIATFQKGNPAKALEYFERALALAPGDALINDNMGAALTRIAMQKKSAADLERALTVYQAAATADPTLASAHNGLGGVYMLMGRRDEAIAVLGKSPGPQAELRPGPLQRRTGLSRQGRQGRGLEKLPQLYNRPRTRDLRPGARRSQRFDSAVPEIKQEQGSTFLFVDAGSPKAGNASRKTHSGGGPRFGGNRRDWFPRLEGDIPGHQRFRVIE